MVGEVFEQLLTDPGFSEADRVGDHHAVVTCQDLARLLHRVFLELGQIDGRPARGQLLRIKVVFEVLEQRFQVDVVRRVLVGTELRGVEQLDQVRLEVPRGCPLALEPLIQLGDGARADGRFQALALLEVVALLPAQRSIHAGRRRLQVIEDLVAFQAGLVREVQLLVRRQPRRREVARADDAGDRLEAVPSQSRRVVVEEVALGVQEAFFVQPHGDFVFAEETDQVFNQPQSGFGEWFPFEIATDTRRESARVRSQPDLFGTARFGAK